MKLQNLLKTSSEWVKGENGGNRIVFSSRLRLARNVNHHPFPGWAKKAEREKVLALVQPAVAELPEMKEAIINDSMEHFTPLEKQVLVEQHLISREHAAKNAGSGLVISKNRGLSVMINEEDHLRIQSLRSGLKLKELLKAVDKLDTELEEPARFRVLAADRLPDGVPDQCGHGHAGVGDDASAGAGAGRPDHANHQGREQDRPGGARALRRRDRGAGQPVPDFEPDDAGRVGGRHREEAG